MEQNSIPNGVLFFSEFAVCLDIYLQYEQM